MESSIQTDRIIKANNPHIITQDSLEKGAR